MTTSDFADKSWYSIIRNSFVPGEYDTEIVRLSVGGNTARVGMVVTYTAQVTAGTPGTHRDVTTATAYSAANNSLRAFAGIILEPVPIPLDTDPDWNIDTLLVDGTYVLILKPTGGRAKVSVFCADQSADLLPGMVVSLSATAGMVGLSTFTFATTATAAQLEAALGALAEKVGVVADVEEDIAGEDVIVNIWY